MPSLLHEAIVTLFRNRPTLAGELLARVWRLRVPAGAGRLLEGDLTQVQPTAYRADLVVAYGEGAAAAAVIVEVQLARDDDKPFVWPLYQAALRAQLRVPVCLLVVTPDAAVARWAGRSVATGQPGVCFAPVVLGPAAMPWVTAAEAARAPELAVLAVLAHHDDAGCPQVARAAIAEVERVDRERAALYTDLVLAHLEPLARAKLEAMMGLGNHMPMSDWGKEWYAKGVAAGEADGAAKGEAKGKAEALLQVLTARGFAPTDVQRTIILACRDLALLDRWLWRAVSAISVDDAMG